MVEPETPQTLALFAPHLNELFRVRVGDETVYPLTLVEVSPLRPAGHRDLRRDPFELRFHGPGPQHLVQRIHRLENDALGALEIFLVPIGRAGDGFVYQAIFN